MMDRFSLFVFVCLLCWVGNLIGKTDASPVIAPYANVEDETHIDEEETNLERGERDVGSGVEPEKKLRKPEIVKLQVRGSVTSRFSSTKVISILRNRAEETAEATFIIRLPEEAFIANFSMEIDGVIYPAEVKEKEKAQKIYNEARDRGQSAGHVKQTSEKMNSFTVSVSVAKKNYVTFELIYEELLTRKNGYFEHKTSIRPGQIVKNIDIRVSIIETQGISEVNTSWIREQDNGDKITKHDIGELVFKGRNNDRAFITYAPSAEEQIQESNDGIEGDYVIRYDVDHPKNGGELQIVNGYFVHYFSPEGLPPVRKNVVFVIDVSGSMGGSKIKQTKEAMVTILNDLREIDYFNIVTFTDTTSRWRATLQQASPENIKAAEIYVNQLRALYGTNLNGGLIDGVNLLKRLTENTEDSIHGVSMLIMLTDGQPTNGETRLDVIERNVEQAIDGKYSLFNLGFGGNVDYAFLEKLALRNRGLARKIYDDSDATLQLEGFFDEVATPLLYNVVFNYPDNFVEANSVTQTSFPNYFQGTELVVTGRIKPAYEINSESLEMIINANSVDVAIEFPLIIDNEVPDVLLNKYAVDNFAERLWAYLSIKELLERRSISNNRTEKEELKQQALQLSLEHHFVTPLTSLVVVKPDEEKPESIEPVAVDVQRRTGGQQGGRHSSSSSYRTYAGNPSMAQPMSLMSGGPRGLLGYPGPPGSIQQSRVYQPTQPKPITFIPNRAFADGDPHFMVNVPHSDLYVCFSIRGVSGDIYSLITDSKNGIIVTGKIIEEPFIRLGKHKHRSYFGEITFIIGKNTIVVNPSQVTFNKAHTFSWDFDVTVGSPEFLLSIVDKKFVRIYIGENTTLAVMRHAGVANGNDTTKVPYLGIYIENGEGLSNDVHGLIGQFQNTKISVDTNSIQVNDDLEVHATLNVKSRIVPVVKQYRMVPVLKQKQPCWFAGDNAAGLIDGRHTDYLQRNIV